MPATTTSPPQPTTLTADGIRAFKTQLGTDNAAVQQSGAPAQLKAEIAEHITTAQMLLENALTSQDIPEWIEQMRGLFGMLTPKLKTALSLSSDEVGACFYLGPTGNVLCIMITKVQCDRLGGSFDNTRTCPP